MEWKGKRVLITGGAGLIGSHLARRLLNEGVQVAIVDNFSSGSRNNIKDLESHAQLLVLEYDLRNAYSCVRAFQIAKPEYVFSFAANMGGIGYITKVGFDIMYDSALINLNMLKAYLETKIASHYFYSSSACVYPEHLQLDTKVKPLKESDAWPAAPDQCFPPSVSILSNGQLKSISDIEEGDSVLTHTGKHEIVMHKMSRYYNGNLIEIQHRMNTQPVQATPNHPFLCLKRLPDKRTYKERIKLGRKRIFLESQWVLAKDIKKGDALLIPIMKDNNHIDIDETFLKIAGFYVAEGSISNRYTKKVYKGCNKKYRNGRRVTLWFGERNIDLMNEISRYLNKNNMYYAIYQHGQCPTLKGMDIMSTKLADELREFGIHAENKVLPEWVVQLPPQKQKVLLDAYLMGDGWNISTLGKSYICASTVSKILGYQLFQILLRQGMKPRMQIIQPKNHMLNGRLIRGRYPSYRILASEYQDNHGSNWASWLDKNYYYVIVKDITILPYKGMVYNMEVKNTHTYTIGSGIVVHNCYGVEKIFTEKVCEAANKDCGGIVKRDAGIRVARFHNVYGAIPTAFDKEKGKAPCHLIWKVLNCPDGGEIEIWGDGKATRSFLYIDDCVDGILKLATSDYLYPVNIGSDRLVTVDELAQIIIKISGKKIGLRHDLTKPQGVRGRNCDLTLVKQVLNWQPKISLDEGLKRTYGWAKEHYSELENI